MSKTSDKANATKSTKARTYLSPAERIAKAEAELQALKAKQQERSGKAITALLEKRAKVEEKIASLNAQIANIDLELVTLGHINTVPGESDEDEQQQLANENKS